jgi:DNA-binding XRE family transcriptional regulator
VLVERLRVVRERLTDTLRLTDTVQVAAALSACRDAVADCEAFRWSATRALIVADSLRHLDSLAQRALALRLGVVRDSLARVTRERDRRPTWRTAWTQATAGVAVGLVAGLIFKEH